MANDFLGGMLKGGLVGSAAIIVLVPTVLFIISPAARSLHAWLSAPTHIASAGIPGLDTSVHIALSSIGLFGGAGIRQTLIVKSPAGELRHDLIQNWGGVHHFSFYVVDNGRIAFIGPYATLDVISLNPLAIQPGPHSDLNSDSWAYVGSFSRGFDRDFTYAFFPADKMEECIALSGDKPAHVRHGFRKHAYRDSC